MSGTCSCRCVHQLCCSADMPHIACSFKQLAQLRSHVACLQPHPLAVDHIRITMLRASQLLL